MAVQSLNTKAELVINASSFQAMGSYGKIMIGDKAFEYFNDNNVNDYIQIPWEEVEVVIASIMFGGRWIPRYAVKTKKNGIFTFSSKDPKKVLRTVRNHIDADKIVKSLSFFDVVKRAFVNIKNKLIKKTA